MDEEKKDENVEKAKRLLKLSGMNSIKPGAKKFAPKAQSGGIQNKPAQQQQQEKETKVKKAPQNVNKHHKPAKKNSTYERQQKNKKQFIQMGSVFEQGVVNSNVYGSGSFQHHPRSTVTIKSEDPIQDPNSSALKKEYSDSIATGVNGQGNDDDMYPEGDIDYDTVYKITEKPIDYPFSDIQVRKEEPGENKSLFTLQLPYTLGNSSGEAGVDDSVLNSSKPGKVGSLKIYKSGKKVIDIGQCSYVLSEMKLSNLNEIVIREDSMEGATKFTNLGAAKFALVAAADIESLIARM